MTLSELLESKFRGDIRFRGAAYIQAERVSVIRVTAEHLFAVVWMASSSKHRSAVTTARSE